LSVAAAAQSSELTTKSIDTTTSGGKLVFHIFGALAEFEREVIHERTRDGLESARARGKKGGRPKIMATDPKKIERARKLYHETGMSPKEICETLYISKTTLYRYVAK
jgi:DNA invertase Pin-like site-specific DNA recombinase